MTESFTILDNRHNTSFTKTVNVLLLEGMLKQKEQLYMCTYFFHLSKTKTRYNYGKRKFYGRSGHRDLKRRCERGRLRKT